MDTKAIQSTSDAAPSSGITLRQVLLGSLGVFFVGVAAVGAVLPGIPTVGPLILASVLFTKSCPWLEKRLIRNRFFARYLPYLDGSVEMSRSAKYASIVAMWTSISISGFVFWLISSYAHILLPTLFVLGLIGTVFILRFGKSPETS